MRLVWLRLKFRVRLRAEEPRMPLELDDLHEVQAPVDAADNQAAPLELVDVGVVHLVTMAVPLPHRGRTIRFVREAARSDRTFVATQPHRRAFIRHPLLLLHQIDHGMRRLGIKLEAVRAFELEHISRELDHRDLQSETNPIVGHLLFAGILRGDDFTFGATVAKPSGDEDAIEPVEPRDAVPLFEIFRVDPADDDLTVIRDSGVRDRFVN